MRLVTTVTFFQNYDPLYFLSLCFPFLIRKPFWLSTTWSRRSDSSVYVWEQYNRKEIRGQHCRKTHLQLPEECRI